MEAQPRPVRLHVERHGAGRPVVLTHGFAESADTWEHQVAALRRHHEVVAWDLRGHGRSDAPADPAAYTREAALADLDRVLGPAREPAVLVGHSLGGYLSLAYALTRPDAVAALVLVATGPGYRDPRAREAWNASLADTARRLGVPEHVAGIVMQHDGLVIDGLRGLDRPALLVVGSDDRGYQAGMAHLHRALPDARLVTVDGARHRPHRTHPDVVNAAVLELTAVPA